MALFEKGAPERKPRSRIKPAPEAPAPSQGRDLGECLVEYAGKGFAVELLLNTRKQIHGPDGAPLPPHWRVIMKHRGGGIGSGEAGDLAAAFREAEADYKFQRTRAKR